MVVAPDSMKRPLRFPFFLFLLPLLLFAVALSFRTAAMRGLFFSPAFLQDQNPDPLPGSALNDTFIRLAAVEDSEPELARDVEDILDGTLQSIDIAGGRFRSLTLWRRRQPGAQVRARPVDRLRFPLRSDEPDHRRMFPEFKRLLDRWFGRRRQQFQPEVMAELLESVKRPIDAHYGYPDTGRPYATCAVVGNSGVLLNSEHGDLIDGHDLVIRLNNARVDGYRRHVGAKTSISFINSNVLHLCAMRDRCSCHPYGDFVPIVIYICQPAHFLEFMVCNASHKSPLLVTDAQFDALCARIVKYYSLKTFAEETGKQPAEWGKHHDEKMFHYSSGMQAIMLAVGICDKVSLFGFGKSAAAKHHYHTNQKAELGLHDYEAEYAFYRDLAARPEEVPFLKDAGFKVPPVVFYQWRDDNIIDLTSPAF